MSGGPPSSDAHAARRRQPLANVWPVTFAVLLLGALLAMPIVPAQQTGAELGIVAIYTVPALPHVDDPFDIRVEIRNDGLVAADFNVTFTIDGVPVVVPVHAEPGDAVLTHQVAANALGPWVHDVVVELDSTDDWSESNENDNEGGHGFFVNADAFDGAAAFTFLGGSARESANDVAIAPDGDIVIVGDTESTDINGDYRPVYSGQHAFVARLSRDLEEVRFVRFLGAASATNTVRANAVGIDAAGDIYVGGEHRNPDFPVTAGSAQPTFAGSAGWTEGFLAKLDGKTGAIVYATHVGGSSNDVVVDLAVRPDGTVAVGGVTSSSNFPTLNAAHTALRGGLDAFVGVYQPNGARLWATLLGGNGSESGNQDAGSMAVAFTADSRVIVVGDTSSNDFPTVGGFDTSYAGNGDAYVARLSAAGVLEYGTYVGGNGNDYAGSLAVSADGRIAFGGFSSSSDFPQGANGFIATTGAGSFAHFSLLNITANQLDYFAHLRGDAHAATAGIAQAPDGTYRLLLDASATDLLVVGGLPHHGSMDAWLGSIDPTLAGTAALVKSGYLGSSAAEDPQALALAGTTEVIVGHAWQGNHLGTAGAVQPVHAGNGQADGFVLRAGSPPPLVLVVDSAGDEPDATLADGVCLTAGNQCTLRAALQQANDLISTQTITFAVGTGQVHIQPATPLPPLTDTVHLDATTQPGYTATPLVTLNGGLLTGFYDVGLLVQVGGGSIAGLSIINFPRSAIHLSGTGNTQQDGTHVWGNWIGVDTAGNVRANGRLNDDGGAIFIDQSSNNLIGGEGLFPNVVSGNKGDGIQVYGYGSTAESNWIGNNIVGLSPALTSAAGPGPGWFGNHHDGIGIGHANDTFVTENIVASNGLEGISVYSESNGTYIADNWIGSAGPIGAVHGNGVNGTGRRGIWLLFGATDSYILRNTIVGGLGPGIELDVAGQTVDLYDNLIGLVENGQGNATTGNDGDGLFVKAGDAYLYDNRIAHNGGDGVRVAPGAVAWIEAGSITANGGLGINATIAGVSVPQLTFAKTEGPEIQVQASVTTDEFAPVHIEVFHDRSCDPSGAGEGANYLGNLDDVDDDGNGAVDLLGTVDRPVGFDLLPGDVITATASYGDGTTAFSICVPLQFGNASKELDVSGFPSEFQAAGQPFELYVEARINGSLAPGTGIVILDLADGPAGARIGGQTTAEFTDGTAVFEDVTLDSLGSYRLRVSAPGYTPALSGNFTVATGNAVEVDVFAQPYDVERSQNFTVSVGLLDGAGHFVGIGEGDSIQFGKASGPGNVTAQLLGSEDGRWHFRVSIDAVGPHVLRANWTANEQTRSTTTAPIQVQPSGGAGLVIDGLPAATSADDAFGFTVRIVDGANATVAGATHDVTVLFDGPAGSHGLTATAVDGVATFTGVHIVRAGAYDVTAFASGLAPGTAQTDVLHGEPALVAYTLPPPSGLAFGESFNVSVEVQDAYGNPATTATRTVALRLGTGSDPGTLQGNLTASTVAATAGFTDLRIDGTGAFRLDARVGDFGSLSAFILANGPGAADVAWLTLSLGASSVGAGNTTNVTVQAFAADGSRLPGGLFVALDVVEADTTAASRIGYVDGDGQFAALVVGSGRILATLDRGSDTVQNTTAVSVVAGPLAQVVITPDAAAAKAGDPPIYFDAEGQDAFGNRIDLGIVQWSLSDLGDNILDRENLTEEVAYDVRTTEDGVYIVDAWVGGIRREAIVVSTSTVADAGETTALVAAGRTVTIGGTEVTAYAAGVAEADAGAFLLITPSEVAGTTSDVLREARVDLQEDVDLFALSLETRFADGALPPELDGANLTGLLEELGAANQAAIYLHVSASVDGEELNETRLNDVLGNLSVTFEVPAAYFAENGLDPDVVRLIEYSNGSVVHSDLFARRVGTSADGLRFIYNATIDEFSTFAIVGASLSSAVGAATGAPASRGGGGAAGTTAGPGAQVSLPTGDPSVPTLEVHLKAGVERSTVVRGQVYQRLPGHPAGAPALPPAVTATHYMQVELANVEEGVVGIAFEVSLTEAQVVDAQRAVLLHLRDGVWHPEGHLALTQVDGRWVGRVSASCCSAFAVAFDLESPQITGRMPFGTVSGFLTIDPAATDNLGIARVHLEDAAGRELANSTTAPFSLALHANDLPEGPFQGRVVATDHAGLTAFAHTNVTVRHTASDGGVVATVQATDADRTWMLLAVAGIAALAIPLAVLLGRRNRVGRSDADASPGSGPGNEATAPEATAVPEAPSATPSPGEPEVAPLGTAGTAAAKRAPRKTAVRKGSGAKAVKPTGARKPSKAVRTPTRKPAKPKSAKAKQVKARSKPRPAPTPRKVR